MNRSRGFTLLELMIAGTVSLVVVLGGFAALNSIQHASARQQEADEIVGAARVAMEVMARDLRTAGDSINRLPQACLGAAATFTPTLWNCAAVLDPHPWRVTIARNAWVDNGTTPDASRFSTNDTPPPAARLFDDDPENAVTFRFVPYAGWTVPKDIGHGRKGVLGRIERVGNPFSFKLGGVPQPPSVAVLLDNVVLDDAMRFNPANAAEIDHRYDNALFMYQLLTKKGEFWGNAALVGRNTTAGDWFLTPPMNLFKPLNVPAAYPADVTGPPYMPTTGYVQSGLGLNTDTTAVTSIVKAPLAGTAPTGSMNAGVPASQLRYLLDRNRIRTVRVSFKVAAPRERRDVTDGFDLDNNPANGTAQLYSFETIVELKPLSRFMTDT